MSTVLNVPAQRLRRVVFHEITQTAIDEAFAHARDLDMDLVNAQQARRILDRLVGYKLSPLLWDKVRSRLSAGRVQSVALRLIVEREREIQAFIPQEYWTLDAELTPHHYDGRGKRPTFRARLARIRGAEVDLKSQADVQTVLIELERSRYVVSRIKEGQRRRQPSPPYTTSTMQQEASRKLGFTAQRTMRIAQQLYEGVEIHGKGTTGLITYIRTDSVRIADEAQKAALEYISDTYGKDYVPKKPNIYKGRKGAQDAHEAIRPADIRLTPQEAKASLNASQYKLYKLIYERFIASQMTEAKLETTSVSFDANGCTYRATGTKVLFPGYTAIYTEGRDDSAEEEAAIPTVSANDIFRAEKVEKEQKT